MLAAPSSHLSHSQQSKPLISLALWTWRVLPHSSHRRGVFVRRWYVRVSLTGVPSTYSTPLSVNGLEVSAMATHCLSPLRLVTATSFSPASR